MSHGQKRDAADVPGVGLCVRCRHSRRIVSARSSTFWLCERSRIDARFAKYPRLPVVACTGHEPETPP